MINVIGQRLSRTQIAVAVIALLVTLLIQWPAVANSLPPPTLTWLTFSYETNPAALEGLQLAQCNDDACQQPTLVAQHGKCTRSGCLSAAEPVQDFRCQGRTCLLAEEGMTGNSILAEGGSFKLIGQFADRVRQSPVAQVNTLGGFLRRNWRVTVSATELRVAEDSGLLTKQGSGLLYWGSFGLTLLLELAVASAYLKKLQANAAVVQRTLISLGLVQFVSYPVVWHFVEIASPFQFLSVRVFAFVCLGIAVLYGLLLLPARKAPERRLVQLSLALWIFLFGAGIVVAVLFSYGPRIPLESGLWPRPVAVAVMEFFAIAYEAAMLKLLSRKALTWQQSGSLSLLTNLASWLLGSLFLAVGGVRSIV